MMYRRANHAPLFIPIIECSLVTPTIKIKKSLSMTALMLGLILPSISYAQDASQDSQTQKQYIMHEARTIYDQMHLKKYDLSFNAFYHGYSAYLNTDGRTKPYLAIADYELPSTQKRFFVMNMDKHKLIYRTWVAQGENTGKLWAQYFSNRFNTHESSLGVFLTQDSYVGRAGYSMRLQGLSPGKNTNAYERDIVVHGASYVSQKFIDENGYLGHSWGCLALPLNMYRHVINTMKNGSVIYSYA